MTENSSLTVGFNPSVLRPLSCHLRDTDIAIAIAIDGYKVIEVKSNLRKVLVGS